MFDSPSMAITERSPSLASRLIKRPIRIRAPQDLHGDLFGPRKLDVSSTLVFFVGALSTYDISLFGRVVVSELLMLVLLPAFAFRLIWLFKRPLPFAVLVSAALAISAILVSDLLVNGVALYDSARGIARIGFFLLPFLFWSAVLYEDPRLLRYYVWGLIPASIIGLFRVSEYDMLSVQIGLVGYEYWLYKVGPLLKSVAFALVMLLYKRSRLLSCAILVVLGVILALFSSRTQAASLLIVAMLIGIMSGYKTSGSRSLIRRRLIAISVIAFSLVVATYVVYIVAAPRGWMGEYQQIKFETQAQSRFGATPWGILLTGRADSFAALRAAWEKPWFGFGSWSIPRTVLPEIYHYLGARMPSYLHERLYMEADAGHSVLFGAWATSGLLAVPLWLVVGLCVIRLFFQAIRLDSSVSPYLLLLAISSAFTLLFNPLNLAARAMLGMVVALVIAIDRHETRDRAIGSKWK